GTRLPVSALTGAEVEDLGSAPEAVASAAKRIRARHVVQVPIRSDDLPDGCVELYRTSNAFDDGARALARLAAAQAGLVIRRFREAEVGDGDGARLALAGDALAVAGDQGETAGHITRLARRATGATACLLWLREGDEPPALVASSGLDRPDAALLDAGEAVERAWGAREAVIVETLVGRLPGGADVSATLKLAQPPIGALQ